ncbi:hypothetical protein H6A03_06905 [[Clostridium] spiroforme]|nr:hypothetical protein [Thomasclavelia spiroformis]MBM6879632.1 hypothetical protein [Thomasclavelia spiroformis]MBM6930177.1 hypothetical protein [Thomasclavelia spiroformis]
MKDILIDFCLVGLLLFFLNGMLNNDYIENTLMEKEIQAFEEDIDNQKVIQYDQGIYDNGEDNGISKCLKIVSDWCINFIKVIMLIISNFISKLL